MSTPHSHNWSTQHMGNLISSIFDGSIFLAICQRFKQKDPGTLQYQGATWEDTWGFYLQILHILDFKQIKVTLKKNAGNNSGQNAKMPATKTMKPHAIVVPGSMLCLTQCQFGW